MAPGFLEVAYMWYLMVPRFFASHAMEEYKKSGVTFKGPNISLPGNFIM